jgi:Ca2+-binding RTX toxin-like protein
VFAGNLANYDVAFNDGFVRVTDNVGDDGSDTLYNVELLKFADQTLVNNTLAVGRPIIEEATLTGALVSPTEGEQLTATPGNITDPNGTETSVFTYRWQTSPQGSLVWTNIAGATAATFTPTQAQVGLRVRVVATFTDDLGSVEAIASEGTIIVGDRYVGNGQANVYGVAQGVNAGSNNLSGLGGADALNGLGGNDVLDGGNGNDTLTGGGGDDSILGGAGNDSLVGGSGADTLIGGAGNDAYVVTDTLNTVTEAAGGGTDTVQTSLTSFVLGDGLENLTYNNSPLPDENFTGTGNGLNNRIQSGSGNDTLDGGGGVDTMLGGAGDDIYHVNISTDVVTEAANAGIDTVIASATDTLGANVENLILVTGAANIGGTGNGLANVMTGNDGNNALNGAAGNDTMTGGLGQDTLDGGGGNDALNGGEGSDELIGGAGVDTFNGGAGDDLLVGGAGNDFLVFEAGFGNDSVTSFDATLAGGQDLLDITSFGVSADPDVFALQVLIAQDGSDTLITIAATGETITLQGVAAVNVTQADFVI